MHQPLFETERLRCRRRVADDIESLLAIYGDAEAMWWVGDGGPLSRAGCEEWVQAESVLGDIHCRTGRIPAATLNKRASGSLGVATARHVIR
jgi:hypothetical protein